MQQMVFRTTTISSASGSQCGQEMSRTQLPEQVHKWWHVADDEIEEAVRKMEIGEGPRVEPAPTNRAKTPPTWNRFCRLPDKQADGQSPAAVIQNRFTKGWA